VTTVYVRDPFTRPYDQDAEPLELDPRMDPDHLPRLPDGAVDVRALCARWDLQVNAR
jgi:hypothetical protein